MMKTGLEFFILKSNKPLQNSAAQCKKIGPERLNYPDRLAGISEGAPSISKYSSFLSHKW